MSITRIIKRCAYFYDNKGFLIGEKHFSKTDKLIEFEGRKYNSPNNFKERITYSTFKRWYWDVDVYHYNVDNPNPLIIDKKVEPLINSEVYNTQLESKILKDLNELSKDKLKIGWKGALIGLIVVVAIVLIATGQISLTGQ